MRRKLALTGFSVAALAAVVLFGRISAEPILAGVGYSQLVLGKNGEILRVTLSGEEKYRVRSRVEEVSPKFLEALLLLEDRHFYSHPGINPFSLVRAAISSYGGGARMGASTLTMQVVRLKYGLFTKNVSGKIRQVLLALQLELFHSKKEILEAYLNLAPYGANLEGIGAASLVYFDKLPSKLTLSESLVLAVLPQNPSSRGFASAAAKRPYERLLALWLESHPRDRAAPPALPDLGRKLSLLPFKAPHFVQHVLAHYPERPVLRTTLNLEVQLAWEKRISAYLRRQANLGIRNAAAVLLNYETMEVESWVGSADFFDEKIEGQVDGVTALRSPGSTIKPFAYALALDQGLIHAQTILKDTPSSFGAFDPENFDGQYLGPVSATEALIQSRNVPAVYLASRLEKPTLYEFLKSNHISLPRSQRYYGLSVVLGGAETSLLELARLYTILARHGESQRPRMVSDVQSDAEKSGLSAEASFVVLDMLAQNPAPKQNFPREWLRRPFPVSWKTGTSRGFRDAWTLALAGPYVAGVWLGNFDNRSNPALVGRELAAPLLFELLDTLDTSRFRNPSFLNSFGLNLKKVPVCSLSGHLPGEHCPAHKPSLFIPGKSPITSCNVHRKIQISRNTGKRICTPRAGEAVVEKVVEFWSSDFLQLFRKAGLARAVPPDFEGSCTEREKAIAGIPPQIVSPKNQVTYNFSLAAKEEQNTIPLRAVTDADVKKVFWYAGNRYLGENPPDKALLWNAEPGDYTIRAVDNLGRSDARQLSVRVVQ